MKKSWLPLAVERAMRTFYQQARWAPTTLPRLLLPSTPAPTSLMSLTIRHSRTTTVGRSAIHNGRRTVKGKERRPAESLAGRSTSPMLKPRPQLAHYLHRYPFLYFLLLSIDTTPTLTSSQAGVQRTRSRRGRREPRGQTPESDRRAT